MNIMIGGGKAVHALYPTEDGSPHWSLCLLGGQMVAVPDPVTCRNCLRSLAKMEVDQGK